jgi:DNA-binding HxlR family transcriptional regulator
MLEGKERSGSFRKPASHNDRLCNIPDCLNDAMSRVQKELQDGERMWLMECNRQGKWSASAVRDRSYESIQQALTEHRKEMEQRGLSNDDRYHYYPDEVVTIAYGKGNTMYQALHNLWLELRLYHRDGTTTARRSPGTKRKRTTD